MIKLISNKNVDIWIESIKILGVDEEREIKHLPTLIQGVNKSTLYVFEDDGYNLKLRIDENEGISVLGAEIPTSLQKLGIEPLEIKTSIKPSPEKTLVLTNLNFLGKTYETAMRYYNMRVLGVEEGVPPPEDISIPSQHAPLDLIQHYGSVPAWLYPIHVDDINKIPSFTIMILSRVREHYFAALGLADNSVTYFHPGMCIKSYTGFEEDTLRFTWLAALGLGDSPYELIERLFEQASLRLNFKLRVHKEKPKNFNGLGWCSWNALGLRDLTSKNVLSVVRDLIVRGVKLSYVIIDDGWQAEKEEELRIPGYAPIKLRVLEDLEPNSEKFEGGFPTLVRELKNLGIRHVGLWHTLNLHWGGFSERVANELSVTAIKSLIQPGCALSPSFSEYFRAYKNLYSKLNKEGFSFVKVDNQWIIEPLYLGVENAGSAAKKAQNALQEASVESGLEILNCMSMTPSCLFNYWRSNVVRASIDYVPFWRSGAKLHNYFCLYNSLLVSQIAYPDYDMFITYDEASLLHLIFRVLSGGPIYITDREVDKTNFDLLRKILLPDGDVVKPDEPALPTLDILFKNPYMEPVLLKAFTRIGKHFVIGVGNVYRHGGVVKDTVSLSHTKYYVPGGNYLVYRVLTNEKFLVSGPDEKVEIELDELEADVLVFTRIEDGLGVAGLRDYLLPPYPIRIKDETSVETRAPGTLIYYKNGDIIELSLREGVLHKL